MLQFSAEQANQSSTKGTRTSTEQPKIGYSEYTLKEKSKKCVLAGLSCELINSMLLFKCSVSSCLENFSTAVLIDFSKHIIKNHESVIWDGNCEACHYKIPIVSDQYYVKNALEHLVSYHLVLKNTEQNPNAKANLEGVSSPCQNTVKNIPIVKKFLRIRRLPGDRLSVHKPWTEGTRNIYDMSVHKSLSDDTNSINNNVNFNINHGSNHKKLPLSSLQISDVNCLKKRQVSISKINSNASDNGNLNVWMKSETNCEIVVSNPEIFLEEGQQIVNNGVPINGAIFLINTSYTKDYIRKLRQFPINLMKTQTAFIAQTSLPALFAHFKCMDRKCPKVFNSKELFKLHMAIHFSKAKKQKRIQSPGVQQFKMCAYCFKAFDDKESLANHIAEQYAFCEYFCPYCFYCAYSASHVLVHQSVVHSDISKNYILKCQYDNGACEYPKEMLSVVDFKEFVLPYKCNVGCCGFSCYQHNDFSEHLNQEHQQCDKFYCYICADNDDGFFALRPSVLITHFKLHNLNKYQCIFCLFGSGNVNSMIRHLAFEHFEYEPLCLERSTIFDDCESKNIADLKILRLEKVIDDGMVKMVNLEAETFYWSLNNDKTFKESSNDDIIVIDDEDDVDLSEKRKLNEPEVVSQRSKNRFIECPDALSIAIKSARIDEEFKSQDAIVSTVPDSVPMAESSTSPESSAHNNTITIMDDDENQSDMSHIKITHYWSSINNEIICIEDDIITIDDEGDVDLSEKQKINEGPTKQICPKIEESINESNQVNCLKFTMIELDKLFVCEKCKIVFSDDVMCYAHLIVCPYFDRMAGQKCMYCEKVYKRARNYVEHTKLHGPDRFKCCLCNFKAPSQKAIIRHMKYHQIINITYVPERPNLTDFNKDNFIVFERKTVNIKSEINCNQCPFKGNTQNIVSHKKYSPKTEQNVDCKDNYRKRFTAVDRVSVDRPRRNMLSTELNKNSNTTIVPNQRRSSTRNKKT